MTLRGWSVVAGMVAGLSCGLVAEAAQAEVRLAGVFGDHMVLQRHEPIRVWGTAAAGEAVQVSLQQSLGRAVAGADGRWWVQLPPLPAGGPHELTVSGSNTVVLRDVLIGDVWLCSGQSNMEWPLSLSHDAAQAIAEADLPLVRHLKIAKRPSLSPQADVDRQPWLVSQPGTAGEFSAVAFHFARRLQRELGVPIGLVNASWGGSHLETWTSPAAARQDPDLAPVLARMPADDAAFAAQDQVRQQALVKRWQGELPLWTSRSMPPWQEIDIDTRRWPVLKAPRIWEEQGLPGLDGSVWLRRTLELTAAQAAGAATLHLGMIDDCDRTWVNGEPVGATCGWDTPRHYPVPAGLLRAGRNVIAVRVVDTGGGGGFHGAAQAMQLETAAGSLPLAGDWLARVEAPARKSAPDFNDLPTLLFNGMLQPLTPMPLRGVIWYQGESNVPRAAHYADAFRRLITDWRQQWQQPQLPFLFVQLSSFLPPERNTLTGSAWAELRDAQRQALSLPGTGMAVSIDVGDAHDIHPRNKRTVGERLALLALQQVHGQALVSSGPVWQSLRTQPGGVAELGFGNLGGGLAVRGPGQALLGFAVAGADQRFVPAQATIVGDRVHVWSPLVAQPQAVRYGWVDNPQDGNLINRAGLPASPFRTDAWPLLTQGVVPTF